MTIAVDMIVAKTGGMIEMRNHIKIALGVVGFTVLLLAPACQTLGAGQGELALLSNPTPEAKEEIKTIVTNSLFGGCINIAANAFVNDPNLVMKSANTWSTNNAPNNANNSEAQEYTERFSLKTYKGKCYLIYDNSGEITLLKYAQCTPVSAVKN